MLVSKCIQGKHVAPAEQSPASRLIRTMVSPPAHLELQAQGVMISTTGNCIDIYTIYDLLDLQTRLVAWKS